MRVIFFGTSHFAAEILKYLLEKGVSISAIVTRPDRPFGRAQEMKAPPVKEMAAHLAPHIPLLQPEKASREEFAQELKTYAADLFVVVAYGEILKQNILDLPRLCAINVHASLLPKYRGAAPMQRALMDGCEETGVTIMKMALEMDAGDTLETVKMHVPEEMSCGELSHALCALACPALLHVIHAFEKGAIRKTPQNPALVTFAPKIKPEEERIHWEARAEEIHNKIRALSPIPGAWCEIEIDKVKKRLKIKRSRAAQGKGAPGARLTGEKGNLLVACGEGALELLEVQLEGKKAMMAGEFLRGVQGELRFY